MSVAGYRAKLRQWETAIRGLHSPAAARLLLRRAPEEWRVALRPAAVGQGAATVTASAHWLRRGLGKMAGDGAGAGAGLAGAKQQLLRQLRLREALAAEPLSPEILAARQKMLAHILAGREFTAHPRRTVAEAMWEQLGAWMAALGRRLSGALPPGQTSGWMVLAIVIAAALGCIGWGVRRWWRGRARPGAGEMAPAEAENSAAWLRRARREADQGRDGAAALSAYYAGLLFGAEAGWWRLRAAATPREYLRCLPAGHPARDGWVELTAALERWRYAGLAGAAEAAKAILRGLGDVGCK